MQIEEERDVMDAIEDAEAGVERAYRRWKMWDELVHRWGELDPSWEGVEKAALRSQYWRGELSKELQSFSEI